jgi:hypothetical protein
LSQLERIDLPGGEPGPGWAWWCPGCLSHHAVDRRWSVSEPETAAPSIVPSVVVRDSSGRVACHSLIRAGVIEFFSDCAHPWAGNSLPMEPFEPPGWGPTEQEGSSPAAPGGE